MRFLRDARRLGSYLIVGVGSDATIRSYKREPIIPQELRLEVVRANREVNFAFIAKNFIGREDCFQAVQVFRPEAWVVDESDPILERKAAHAEQCGSQLVVRARPEDRVSTTAIIEKIRGT